MEWWLNFLGWFLSVVTAAGNGFVIFLLSRSRRLRVSDNRFVLSLAIADFSVGFAVFPSGYLCSIWKTCNLRVYIAFYWFFLHSSVTNLCVLTWDRYAFIVYPFKYHTFVTSRRPTIVIMLAWSISFALALFLVLGMYATNSPTAWKATRLTGVAAFDIFSCILLFYAVVRILIVQAQQNSALEAEERRLSHSQTLNQVSLPRRRSRRRNTAGFIIAVVMFFLVCYMIVNYLLFCIAFSCNRLPDNAGLVITFLLIGNSAVNPLVYAFLKRDIKRETRRLICERWREQHKNDIERSRSTFLSLL